MAITFTSRSIRRNTKNRKISFGAAIQVIKTLRPLFRFIGGLVAFAVKFLVINVVTIVQAIVQTTITLLNFDWNSSDEQIQAIINGNNLAIIAQLGALTGNALAWTVCLGGAALIEKRLPIIRGKLLVELAQQAGVEARALLNTLITTTARSLAINSIISTYRDIRRWITSDDPIGSRIGKFLFGDNYNEVREKWGKSGEPFIISEVIEDRVQALPGAGLVTFTSSLLDEFGDALTECLFEAAYIIQRTYDDDLAYNNYASGNSFTSPELIVDIIPNTGAIVPNRPTNDIIRVTAPSKMALKQQISTVLATSKLLDNRDVGFIIGEPAEDRLVSRPYERQLVLTYRSQPVPPFIESDGRPAKTITVTIPEPIVGLTWQQLKTLFTSYPWGRFRGISQLSQGRKIILHAASTSEAETQLQKCLNITTLMELSNSVTEEKFRRNQGLVKQITQIYLVSATLTARFNNNGQGRPFADGRTLADNIQTMILWTNEAPPNTPVFR